MAEVFPKFKDIEEITAEDSSFKLEEYICISLDQGAKVKSCAIFIFVKLSGIEGLDPVDEFTSWLGKKVGGRNEHLQSFTIIVSTFAVLEVAQNVLNVGSGFTKMELSGITLMQIKETVKRIEGKVDRMLEAPLKNAKMHCDSAITRISHKRMEDAYHLFDKVINEATNA